MTTTTPRISRRTFLRGAAATLIAVAGGTVYRAADQGVFSAGQGPAFALWTTWRSDAAEGPVALVRAGILAANPHNTKPWLFRVGADRIDLYADTRRNIGAVDPFLREMYMGLGAALENMLLATSAQGYQATLTLMPDAADPTHAAQIALAPGVAQPSALYAAIPKRHTDRGAYDTARPVAAETLAALAALNTDSDDLRVRWFTSAAERADREVQLGHAPRFGDALQELAGEAGWHGLMPFRVGYPTVAVGANPRRAVEDVLITD